MPGQTQPDPDVEKTGGARKHLLQRRATSKILDSALSRREKKANSFSTRIWPFLAGSVVICWMVIGVAIGMQVEGWGFLTSLYVITQIITTIGYGDITVHTPAMKLFMTVYVFGCLVFISFITNKYADRVLAKNSEFFQAQMQRVEDKMNLRGRNLGFYSRVIRPRIAACRNFLMAFGGFAFFVTVGTVYFAVYESCSCSYGVTKVEGCDRDYCPETGGYVKTWVDAWYMSVITLTTVGFGDHSPRSYQGRLFGIFWMIFGVISCASFVGSCAELFFMESGDRIGDFKLNSPEVFKELDHEGKGYFTEAEFMEYLLLKYNLVDTRDLEVIRKHFVEIDKDANGKVTVEEVHDAYERNK